jgi:hypothetical protein
LHGAGQQRQRFLVSAEIGEEFAIPLVAGGVARRELEAELVLPLRSGQLAVRFQHGRAGDVRLAEIGRQR